MAKHTVQEIAARVQAQVVGDPQVLVSGIRSITSANPGSLVYADSPVALAQALLSPAAVVLTGEFARQKTSVKPLIICRQPKLAFSRVAALFRSSPQTQGIHSSAVIDPAARLAGNTAVGAHTVIGSSAMIGEETTFGANCVIEGGVSIGSHCEIGHNVTIHSGCRLGDRVVVQSGTVLGSTGFGYVRDESTGHYHQFPQIGNLIIEHDVEIGANCTIDRGALDSTIIRRGTKLDNQIHIGHNVDVGEDVVIAAQTGISGSSVIGPGAVVGGQVGIGDHVLIGEGVILGSGAGVLSKKVLRGKGIVFWGVPARPLREYLRELAMLARLAKKDSK